MRKSWYAAGRVPGDETALGWVQRSPHWDSVIGAFHRYEMRGRLGSGGMAEIFLAREKDAPQRTVAIKRLLPAVANEPELCAMFADEARLGMRITHRHLCRVYDVGDLEGHLCIAMEYVDGVELGDLIDRAPNGLLVGAALSIIAAVAAALHSVHRARDELGRPLGIVHRDVTPQNVMIGYDGSVKLLDFGLAKSALNEAITRPGYAKGKFAYLAPELWSEGKADPRSDIFALGVCLFEALTGKRLYFRSSPFECKKAICEGPVPSLREYLPKAPKAIDTIVSRCLAKRPEDRFESAGALSTALYELVELLGMKIDDQGIANVVLERFREEHTRGPVLEPTSFGKRASSRPPAMVTTSTHPSLPPAVLVPRRAAVAPRRVPPVFVGTLIGMSTVGAIAAVLIFATREPIVVPTPAASSAPQQVALAPIPPPVERPRRRIARPAPVVERVVELEPFQVPTPAPVARGLLSVNSRPWSEVFVDGRSVGMTPLAELPLAAGAHQVTLVDPEGVAHRLSVDVPAGGEEHVFRQLDRPEEATPRPEPDPLLDPT